VDVAGLGRSFFADAATTGRANDSLIVNL